MCGIFGCISIKPRKFNKALFNTLGIDNDSRGGDSCGVFIDGKVEYGVNNKKLFYDFFKESELVRGTSHYNIALGHCRKASVGGVKPELAHPICIYDDQDNIQFALIHNGTIENYKELAKKYIPEIDIKGRSDSQVLAQIIYHTGYDVFNDYVGAIATVFVDYREESPRIFFWKGASKKYKAGKIEEERPLFGVYKHEQFWFSSLPEYLEAHYMNDEDVWSVGENTLYEFLEGGFVTIQKFPKHGESVRAATTVTYYGNYSGIYSGRNYDLWDDCSCSNPSAPVTTTNTPTTYNSYIGRINLVPGSMFTKGTVTVNFIPYGNNVENINDLDEVYITSYGGVHLHKPEYVNYLSACIYNNLLFPTASEARVAEELLFEMSSFSKDSPLISDYMDLIIESSLYPVIVKDGFMYEITSGIYRLFSGDMFNISNGHIYTYKNGLEVGKSTAVSTLEQWNHKLLIKVKK